MRTQIRRHIPSSSGSAKLIISCGRISGTPPTLVETTYNPAQAASRMAIPKDSVSDVFMKIVPRDKTYDGGTSIGTNLHGHLWIHTESTSLWRTAPNNSIRSCRRCFSRIWRRSINLGPSPPAILDSCHGIPDYKDSTYQRRTSRLGMWHKYEERLLQAGRCPYDMQVLKERQL